MFKQYLSEHIPERYGGITVPDMLTVQEIRRAKAKLLALKAGGISQFARKLDKAESQVRHWIGPTPVKNIGTQIAREIEKAMKVPKAWLDTLDGIEELANSVGADLEEIIPGLKAARRTGNVIPLPVKERVVVPQLDVSASAGKGVSVPDIEAVIDHLRLSEDWCRRNLSVSSLQNLAALSAYGDSMRPTFEDGDILLVDRGVSELKIDAVYVLKFRDELYVKRIQRRPDGNIVVKSDNTLYDPFVIDPAQNNLEVLGRVVWAWNGKKL